MAERAGFSVVEPGELRVGELGVGEEKSHCGCWGMGLGGEREGVGIVGTRICR